MGGCGSKSTHALQVDTGDLTGRTEKKRESFDEIGRRSLAGNLMQTHHGSDSLRLEEEYDDSEARVLGSGMSGTVSTVKHRRTGVIYALKTLNIHAMGVDGLEELRREINAMRRLDHPNIVKVYEIFEDRDNIHMILELCTGMRLQEPLHGGPYGRFPPTHPPPSAAPSTRRQSDGAALSDRRAVHARWAQAASSLRGSWRCPTASRSARRRVT